MPSKGETETSQHLIVGEEKFRLPAWRLHSSARTMRSNNTHGLLLCQGTGIANIEKPIPESQLQIWAKVLARKLYHGSGDSLGASRLGDVLGCDASLKTYTLRKRRETLAAPKTIDLSRGAGTSSRPRLAGGGPRLNAGQ